MELAKNDSDKLRLNKQMFNLDEELSSLVQVYKDLAENENKNLNVSFEYKEEINADLNMIKQLVVILLDNSIKYTQSKDSIEIKTYKQDGKAVLEVVDTGIGISNEAIDHIFERFYREEKSRNREKGGMGLGLSIAYNIVNLHKGTIKFEKNREKGARVVVKLPIK
ncbi:MAG: HAMP domain-containing histidine kinase [Clostridia bacterium]|nr:HAMP domain-containing histidine kinase [Clostridia bacterium]